VLESAVETDDSLRFWGFSVDWRSRLIAKSKSAPSHAAQRSAAHYGLPRSSASPAAEKGD
jgi:hypothetical protein